MDGDRKHDGETNKERDKTNLVWDDRIGAALAFWSCEKIMRDGDKQTEKVIMNSNSSFRKLSKNEIQQPNNYKKSFECV